MLSCLCALSQQCRRLSITFPLKAVSVIQWLGRRIGQILGPAMGDWWAGGKKEGSRPSGATVGLVYCCRPGVSVFQSLMCCTKGGQPFLHLLVFSEEASCILWCHLACQASPFCLGPPCVLVGRRYSWGGNSCCGVGVELRGISASSCFLCCGFEWLSPENVCFFNYFWKSLPPRPWEEMQEQLLYFGWCLDCGPTVGSPHLFGDASPMWFVQSTNFFLCSCHVHFLLSTEESVC